LEARKVPKILWKVMQELGYEKQPEYFGTQVTYEGSEPVGHVHVYIFTPKPLRGVYEVENDSRMSPDLSRGTGKSIGGELNYHTPVPKSRTEASIHAPRMFNHTHSNNMISR
jgi:hypothetical protein